MPPICSITVSAEGGVLSVSFGGGRLVPSLSVE